MSQRNALLIGNQSFDDAQLSTLLAPGHDVQSLAQVLQNPAVGGFSVDVLIDADSQAMHRAIARLYRGKEENDVLLLYYSGHGIRDEFGDLCLVARDTDTALASATAITANFVGSEVEKSTANQKVIFLDCCHSGSFLGGQAAGPRAGTLDAFGATGLAVMSAADAVGYAHIPSGLEGEAEMSLFTHFLVEALKTGDADLDGDGEISLDELYEYVFEEVTGSRLSHQKPVYRKVAVSRSLLIAHAAGSGINDARAGTATTASGTGPQVFICHSSHDKSAVRKLRKDLQEAGFSPWLDEEDILPGQDWELEIKRAIERSDFFLVCLSENSVDKRGFVQKEIRLGLEVLEQVPEGRVFVVPVRLEDCDVPESLRSLHWTDLFAVGGWERLLKALRSR